MKPVCDIVVGCEFVSNSSLLYFVEYVKRKLRRKSDHVNTWRTECKQYWASKETLRQIRYEGIFFLITLNAEFWKPRLVFYYKWPTIPDKTTWESFPHHVNFPTQQNYFQNDAFAEWKPLPPIQCCFLQTPRDQEFFWIHNNIAFRGRGRGKNRYSYDV